MTKYTCALVNPETHERRVVVVELADHEIDASAEHLAQVVACAYDCERRRLGHPTPTNVGKSICAPCAHPAGRGNSFYFRLSPGAPRGYFLGRFEFSNGR
jgi:hypothetical protein